MLKIYSNENNPPQIIEESHSTHESEDIFRIKLICCQCLKDEDYDYHKKTSLKRCTICKSVWYCNKECQSLAWKTHRAVCQKTEKYDRGLDLNQWKILSGISTYYDEGKKYQPIAQIPNDEEKVCKFQNVDGELREITQKEFKELTGMTFTKGALFPQKILIKMHERGEIQSARPSLKAYNSVALAKDEGLGFELIAIDQIPKGATVAFLGGKVFDNEEVDLSNRSLKYRAYALTSEKDTCTYDPSNYADLGAFVNDGPPNCCFLNQSSPMDEENTLQSKEIFIVALRDIYPKEKIYVDYGKNHDVKFSPYILSETAFKDLVIMCESNPKEIMHYILYTPYVLALLFLRGIFDKNPKLYQSIKESMNSTKKTVDFSLLSALALIPKHDREAYAEKLSTFSQRSLKILCTYIHKYQMNLPVEQWQLMGQLIDRMFVLLFGASHGNYWLGGEKDRFLKQFLSQEHQNELKDFRAGKFSNCFDETILRTLPISFLNEINDLSNDLLSKISANYLPK